LPAARRSGREPGAALGAASAEDRASSARAHAQAKAVGFSPATVVRLESALAHSEAPGIWYYGLTVVRALRASGSCRQKTRCSDIVPRLATNWLTAPRRTSAAAGDPSLGCHNFPRTRAKPFTVSRTVDNLDAGTQRRAVGDSTEPRYGAAVGAVKPAPQREANPGGPVPDNAITAAQVSPGPARPGNHRWVDRSVCRAGGGAVTRHARPDKKCPARCGQPLAARPTGLLASPVVGRLPYPSRARSASLRAAPR